MVTNPNVAAPVSDEHIECTYNSKTLGGSSPGSRIHSMWLICNTHVGMRTGKEMHSLSLCWGDIRLGLGFSSGDEFLTLNTELQTKTQAGANARDLS